MPVTNELTFLSLGSFLLLDKEHMSENIWQTTKPGLTRPKEIEQAFLFKKQLHEAPLEWPYTSTNQPFSSPLMHLGYERI